MVSLLRNKKTQNLLVVALAGASRLFIVGWIGLIYGAEAANSISNDLGIAAFLVMFTGVSVSAQLLHLIPGLSRQKAIYRLNGVIKAWVPSVLLLLVILWGAAQIKPGLLACGYSIYLFLISQTIYWIMRGYWLASMQYLQILWVDIVGYTALVLVGILYWYGLHLDAVDAFNAYAVAMLLTALTLYWQVKKEFPSDSEPIDPKKFWYTGLSNLASGGLLALSPSICYQTGGQMLAGFVSMANSLYAMVAMVVRAKLTEAVPLIAAQIKLGQKPQHTILRATLSIHRLLVWGFLIATLAIFGYAMWQSSISWRLAGFAAMLSGLYALIPQWTSLEYALLDGTGMGRSLLLINLLICFSTFAFLGLMRSWMGPMPEIFLGFLSIGCVAYWLRSCYVRGKSKAAGFIV